MDQFRPTSPRNASSLIPIAASIARASSLASAVGRLGREHLRKPALEIVELGAIVLAKAEEATGIWCG